MSGEALVELRDVEVAYHGRTALRVPRLAVERGELLTLVGPNGCGKSTLLRTLGLLRHPERGELRFGGAPVAPGRPKQLLALRRRSSGVFQEPLLFRMSVARNVALGLRFRGVPRAESRRRVEHWLERLRIPHLRDRAAGELSGGEAQRVSLARALVLEPELLLLDEPFSALDPPTRQALSQELQEILAEGAVTTVFATHDRGEALALGDRVAVLRDGAIAQIGPTEQVFARPADEGVARFLGMETLLPGRVRGCEGGLVRVDAGGVDVEVGGEARPGDPVLVSVRPEEITLHAGAEAPTGSARNVLQGRVAKIVPLDAHVRVEVDCGVTVVAAVTRPSLRGLGLEVGAPVTVAFKALSAHLIPRPRH